MEQAEPASGYRTLRVADSDEFAAAARRQADIELLQASRGAAKSRFLRYEGRQVTMHHTFLPGTTILQGAVDPEFLVLALPLRWDRQVRNGVLLEQPHLLAYDDEFSRSATNLETLGFGFRKEPLEAASLALAGPGAHVHVLRCLAITKPSTELASLVRRMHRFDEAVRLRVKELERVEYREMLEQQLITEVVAFLSKVYGSSAKAHRLDWGGKRQAVRRAEERFEAAGERPVSLADLCLAAGVSARTLQYAFHDLYGMSPMQYFKVRRLHEAHRLLKSATPERGAVKRAALSAGLTELGRFSVEYRELFGKSPSATLTES